MDSYLSYNKSFLFSLHKGGLSEKLGQVCYGRVNRTSGYSRKALSTHSYTHKGSSEAALHIQKARENMFLLYWSCVIMALFCYATVNLIQKSYTVSHRLFSPKTEGIVIVIVLSMVARSGMVVTLAAFIGFSGLLDPVPTDKIWHWAFGRVVKLLACFLLIELLVNWRGRSGSMFKMPCWSYCFDFHSCNDL